MHGQKIKNIVKSLDECSMLTQIALLVVQKKRGLPQFGTLGAGNHYVEVQVVDEIYNQAAADKMGIGKLGQVVIFIHSGSRGLGHQVTEFF